MICVSCNTECDANFCPHCGEQSGIKKLTYKSVFEDALSTITYMDKGFLYNVKTLLINPKAIAIDYIFGKRKGIFNPVSFLIFSVTLYLIIANLYEIPKGDMVKDNLPDNYFGKVGYLGGKFIHTYFKYFWILSVIPLAASIKLVFRKYSFIEHLAISSFILGISTLIGVLSYVLLKLPLVVNPFVYLAILWLVYRLFVSEKRGFETLVMSFSVLMLFCVQLFFITLGMGFIMALIIQA
jgi:hypothetical protein